MGVLVALYESKILKIVNMDDVLQLYGLEPSEVGWVDFESKAFQADYILYKNQHSFDDIPENTEFH